MKIPAWKLTDSHTMIGKSGAEAEVHEVTHAASGVYVTLDTEFGEVARRYDEDEMVEVK